MRILSFLLIVSLKAAMLLLSTGCLPIDIIAPCLTHQPRKCNLVQIHLQPPHLFQLFLLQRLTPTHPPREIAQEIRQGRLERGRSGKAWHEGRTDVEDRYDTAKDGQVDCDPLVQMPHKINETECEECNGGVEHEWECAGDGWDTEVIQTLVPVLSQSTCLGQSLRTVLPCAREEEVDLISIKPLLA